MHRHRTRAGAAVAATAALAVAGCGGSSGDGGTPAPVPAEPSLTAARQDFPKPGGRTLSAVAAGLAEGPVFQPTVGLLERGRNRFGFGLFDVGGRPIAGAGAAVYVADEDGTHVRGPFVARSESLAVKPQFESRTTAQDPDSAKNVYVADVPFRREGRALVMAVARMDGRVLAASPRTMQVGTRGATPPRVGELAPRIHTATLASVGGDAEKLTTRVPPNLAMLRTDAADVLGRKPLVLVFATPQLCASRVCGPTVDIADEVRAKTAGGATFVHQEIYRDNDASKPFRPQVRAYRLPSEPWTFVIDRRGRVSARFEGAVSVGELQRAVAKVAR